MIRPARVDDFEQINDILYEAFNFHHSRRFFIQKLEAKRLYVYEVDGEVVGVMDIIIEKDSVYISLLAVKKEYRNRGIGSKFLKFAEGLAKKYGKEYITTHPEIRAIDYYLKKGFEFIEKYENGKIEYLMIKRLKK